uniref:Putative ixostatin n=1 Tax=Ixodes ricinus TaxID=34613 RepID=A0A0K8R9Q7_IXORI
MFNAVKIFTCKVAVIQMSVFMIIMGLALLVHEQRVQDCRKHTQDQLRNTANNCCHHVESTCGNWYLDKNLSHMREECKTKLRSQFDTECKRIGGEFKDFNVCHIQCQVTTERFVKLQNVYLKNGLPCGPYGEKCLQGSCYGPCEVQFFNPPKPRSDE